MGIKRHSKFVIFGDYYEKSKQAEIKFVYIIQEISFMMFDDSIVKFESTNEIQDSIITFTYKGTTGIVDIEKLSEVSSVKNQNIVRELDKLIYSFLALKKYEDKKYDDCVRIAELVQIGDKENELGAINILAQCLEENNDLDKLLIICNKIINIKPQSYKAYLQRATCLYKMKKFNEGIKDCNTALTIEPKSGRAYNIRGSIFMTIGELDNAISDFTKALSIDSLNIPAIDNRGNCYLKKKQYDLAMKDFNYEVNLNPTSEAYMNRGVCYRRLAMYDDALADYNNSIKLNNQNHLSYFNRGSLYFENFKKFDSAISDFTDCN